MPETPVQSSHRPKTAVELNYVPGARPLRKRMVWSMRAWSRSTFSRESMVGSLKSLLWVAPLTVLIWIYAEREQVVTMSNVAINLETRLSEPGRVVRLVYPAGGTLHIEMRGAQAELEQVKDWLESTTIPIDVDHNLAPGEHQIPIAAELNRMPRVLSKGVTVSNCVPSEVRVVIDPIKDWDLDVKVRPEDANLFSGPQVFTPARVRISGPRSVIERAIQQAAGQGQTLVAYANLAPFKKQLSEVGKHPVSAIALTPSVFIDDPNVTLSPATVSADLTVTDNAERSFTLPYMRVLAAYPSDSASPKADQWKAVYDTTISNVTVSGPEQQIEQLKAGKYTGSSAPTAIFEVNFSDTENPAPAPLMFQLPPGVHVSEQDAQRKITYSFKPRNVEPQ